MELILIYIIFIINYLNANSTNYPNKYEIPQLDSLSQPKSLKNSANKIIIIHAYV